MSISLIEITSLDAPELDAYARLTHAQLRARKDPEKGIFIAEGLKVIGHALDAGCEPLSFLMERKHVHGKAWDTLARCEGVPVYTADSDVLAGLTGFALTRGVLCAMRRPPAMAVDDVMADARRVVAVEDVVDAANLGAIFRNAAALGADAVLLTPGCCDPLSRRALRVSMGTVFQIPWARMAKWPGEGMQLLHREGFSTAALALDERAVPITDPALRRLEKLALILGTEGDGLKDGTIALCDHTVMIPMSHGVDSLNVAAASAVALWALRPESMEVT